MSKKFKKIISLVLCFCFLLTQTGLAQTLPIAQQTANLSSLSLLRYLSVNEANPNNYFNFLLDKGNIDQIAISEGRSIAGLDKELNQEAKKLINYFFLGITLPGEAFWVNLKPAESDRITSDELSQTDLGKTLLEQDLRLKKDMSQYLNPQNPVGRQFWEKLYTALGKDKVKKAQITTSNRVWIVPDKAVVLETEDGALVVQAKLKVLLESEYAALENNKVLSHKLQITSESQKTEEQNNEQNEPNDSNLQVLTESLMKEIIIPAIIKDVNESQSYAPLRQVYHSLILAQWFKHKHKNGSSAYSQAINKGDIKGLESQFPWEKQQIYQDYLKSYTNGEYKFIDKTIFNLKRMYFSGGIVFREANVHGGSFESISSPLKTTDSDPSFDITVVSSDTITPSQLNSVVSNTSLTDTTTVLTTTDGTLGNTTITTGGGYNITKSIKEASGNQSFSSLPALSEGQSKQPGAFLEAGQVDDHVKPVRLNKEVSSPVSNKLVSAVLSLSLLFPSLSAGETEDAKLMHWLRAVHPNHVLIYYAGSKLPDEIYILTPSKHETPIKHEVLETSIPSIFSKNRTYFDQVATMSYGDMIAWFNDPERSYGEGFVYFTIAQPDIVLKLLKYDREAVLDLMVNKPGYLRSAGGIIIELYSYDKDAAIELLKEIIDRNINGKAYGDKKIYNDKIEYIFYEIDYWNEEDPFLTDNKNDVHASIYSKRVKNAQEVLDAIEDSMGEKEFLKYRDEIGLYSLSTFTELVLQGSSEALAVGKGIMDRYSEGRISKDTVYEMFSDLIARANKLENLSLSEGNNMAPGYLKILEFAKDMLEKLKNHTTQPWLEDLLEEIEERYKKEETSDDASGGAEPDGESNASSPASRLTDKQVNMMPETGGIDGSTGSPSIPEVKKTGGIDLSKIELTLKDEKFVSSLNPADLKILRAARAVKQGWNSLAVLYVHEVMLLFKYNLAKDFTQRQTALQILNQLKDRQVLDDEEAVVFFSKLQPNQPIPQGYI